MRKFSLLLVTAVLISTFGAIQTSTSVQAASTLSFAPTSYTFPSTIVGTRSAPKEFSIKNTGSVDVILEHLSVVGDFRLKAGTCTTGMVLVPNQTCTFNVVFAPLAITYRTGIVYVPSNADNPLYTIPVNGYGTGTNLLKSPNMDFPFSKPNPWRVEPTVPTIEEILDCSVWVSPLCSLRLRGSTQNNRISFWQAVRTIGEIGHRYAFILTSKAKAVPISGIYRMEVELLNTYNQRVGYKEVIFKTGTHDWKTQAGTIKATQQFIWVVYRISFQKTGGTAWFDNAILVKIP